MPNILGRPFLATWQTLIDVQKRELPMPVNDQQITFNVLDTMKSPDDVEDCNFISLIDFVVVERLNNWYSNEKIKTITFEELEDKDLEIADIA